MIKLSGANVSNLNISGQENGILVTGIGNIESITSFFEHTYVNSATLSTDKDSILIVADPASTTGQVQVLASSNDDGVFDTKLALTYASDLAAVAADKAALTWDVVKGSNTSQTSLTSNLTLPTTGTNGSTITWQSTNPAVISASGNVTRPASGAANQTVTFTATLSRGEASDTVTFTLTVLAQSSSAFTVSGLVKSYFPIKSATLQLFKGTEMEAAYTTYTVHAESGSGQTEQEFTFDGVESGTYTLVISKEAHATFTVHNIFVDGGDVNLTADYRPEVRLMTLRCGDINGDGNINNSDLTILWQQANYNRSAAAADNELCDLNGDGLINNIDLTILWLAYNYNRGAVVIE
jgi:hypothetical protein